MSNLHRFIQVIYLLINFSVAAGLLCYDCQNIAHPRDCRRVTLCGTHEECYAEQRISTYGNISFNIGCSSRCSTAGKRSVGIQNLANNTTQLQRREDLTVCYQCCKSSSYCNQNQCDVSSPAVSLTNRTSCLFCQDVDSPDKCEFTQLCDVNQVCYTETIRINGEDRYRLGCVDPVACSMGGSAQPNLIGRKRFLVDSRTRYCGKCCKDGIGNCNRDLCRTGGVLIHGAVMGQLNNPPPQRNCEDINTDRCKKLLQTDPDTCLNTTISNYDCRRTCGCASGSSSGGTTVVLPQTDCFYESSRYKGVYRTTSKGEVCISWSTVYRHTLPPGPGFPEPTIRDAENKCRDPVGKGHPWCYTSKLAWDFCDVPYCEDCYYPGQESKFTGYISKNADNRTCDPWSTLKGHVSLSDTLFPDGSVVNADRNCRDPFRVGFMCVTSGFLTSCDVKQCQGPCQDDQNTNCRLIKHFVCLSEYTKRTLCPKTCGYCDVGLLPPRKVSPPAKECVDVVGANCPVLKDLICKDITQAKRLCPQTCDVGCAVRVGTATSPMTQTVTTQTTTSTTQTTQRTTASTTLATTKQPDQCHDDPAFRCNPPDSPEIKVLVCTALDPKVSAVLCPKTCGYCDGCNDAINCSSQHTETRFCSDNTLAITYCKRTCRKCLEKTIPITLNSCGDPVAESKCPLLDREILICKDPEMRQLCEHFCNGECANKPIKTRHQ